MRKGLCIIICALLLMSCNVYVFADEVETCAMPVAPGISPMMEYIARSSAKISADSAVQIRYLYVVQTTNGPITLSFITDTLIKPTDVTIYPNT